MVDWGIQAKQASLPWVVYGRHSVSARRKWIQWESPFYKCWEAQIQETWSKGFTAEVAKPRLSVRLTLHTSCFMTVFLSRETLGTRVSSGNRMHVHWFHTSLRSFLPGFLGPCVSWFIHFPRDPWASRITVSVWFDLSVYSFIKFQISKFNTWWAQGRWWLMIFLAKWGERARTANIGTILPTLICPISNQLLISARLCKGNGPFLEPRPH